MAEGRWTPFLSTDKRRPLERLTLRGKKMLFSWNIIFQGAHEVVPDVEGGELKVV